MSQEKILKTLESLGLSPYDAQVYLFLGKRGPQKTKDISHALKMSKQHLYLILKNLQSKGVVHATIEHPAKFSAIPFERVLDLFIKAKMEDAQRIKHDKTQILSDWQSIAITEAADQPPKFAVIEGKNFIYPRLRQMIEETSSQLSVISTVASLMSADHQGLLVAALNQASKSKAKVRLLIELTNENLKALKQFLAHISKISSNFEGKSPELGLKPISRLLLRDNTEIAFFLSQDVESGMKDRDEVCLWTNSKTIVNSFKAVFEDLWKNSVPLENRIAEIETGKPTARTYVINDPLVAREKLQEIIGKASSQITILTSARGLIETWRKIDQLRDIVKRGVSVEIMAPVTRENFEATQQLASCCEVRHVSTSYLRTTIVDGKHLFQSRNATSDRENDVLLSFENSFYTNDLEYVNRTKELLDDIWKTAYKPSTITLEEIVNPQRLKAPPISEDEYVISRKDSPYQKITLGVQEKVGVLTEQEILKKIMTAKRSFVRNPTRDVVQIYGCEAMCAIHPPKNFNLPDMMISAWHCSKQSSFGAEDWFQVYLWLETPKGHSYVPVVVFGDNAKALERRRLSFAGTPAGKNCQLLRKDALQIQMHSNSLFAGWTVPISLFPPKYVLPPAALLFEGYGKLKTVVNTVTMPSGTKIIIEGNGFDAFVTFFHPESKYSGPGTDGTIARDMIMTVIPPSSSPSGTKEQVSMHDK